jgi:hypothetical protein
LAEYADEVIVTLIPEPLDEVGAFYEDFEQVLEPAGWFLFWTALDSMFYDLRSLKKERNFYRALSKLPIHFKSS